MISLLGGGFYVVALDAVLQPLIRWQNYLSFEKMESFGLYYFIKPWFICMKWIYWQHKRRRVKISIALEAIYALRAKQPSTKIKETQEMIRAG